MGRLLIVLDVSSIAPEDGEKGFWTADGRGLIDRTSPRITG